VLTKYKAGSVTAAEQGDFIEVRLDEPAPTQGIWQMSSQTGYARIQALGETALVQDATGTKRVFRFQALGIGELELAFAFHAPPQAPKPQQVLTFRLVIK
jgi:hypothetical protein